MIDKENIAIECLTNKFLIRKNIPMQIEISNQREFLQKESFPGSSLEKNKEKEKDKNKNIPIQNANVICKKKRKRKTKVQLAILISEFDQNPFPDKEKKNLIKSITGLTLKEITIWFQNKRAKVKKANGEISIPNWNFYKFGKIEF